jgi:5-methylcytosine-specific restriction protein A
MPTRPPRAHVQRTTPKPPKPRLSAAKRGYDTKWQEARAGFLAKHPLCECPDHQGRAGAPRADVVDHIQPHKGDPAKFWDRNNWMPMNRGCHSAKTARMDGGFGNKRRLPEDRIKGRV